MSDLPEHNDDVKNRLNVLISILTNPIKIQESTLREKIAFLDSFGLDYKEISKILRTTPSLVSKEKSLLKRSMKNE